MEKALAIEEKIGCPDVAQTHLNLCAVLSQIGKHDCAQKHAYVAVMRVYELVLPELGAPGSKSDALKEHMSVLCIGYHNLAVEEEFLRSPRAIETYKRGLHYAEAYLAVDHPIRNILRNSIENVKKSFVPQVRKASGSRGRNLGKK